MIKRILQGSVIAAVASSSMAYAEDTKITFGGFVKLDAYNDDKVNSSLGPRGYDLLDFRSIPLDGTAAADKSGSTKFHGRASRVYIETETPFQGDVIKTHIEGDFFGRVDTGGGTDDDTLTNSYELRLRSAWVSWGNWMAGQNWSNFVDLSAYPEGMDFSSITGRALIRQSQIRYTYPLGGGDRLAFSLENPETDYNRGTPAPGANADEDETMPDIIGTYYNKTSFGHVRASALVRRLGVETFNTGGDISNSQSDHTMGYGIGLSAKINFSKELNLKLNFNGGDGIGRYLHSNHYRSAIFTADGKLESESAWGANFMLQYKPSATMRYNIGYGLLEIDVEKDHIVSTAVNKSIGTFHANAIYTIAPQLNVGVGYTYAEREVENGTEGDISRIMFYIKKDFKMSF